MVGEEGGAGSEGWTVTWSGAACWRLAKSVGSLILTV